MRIIKRVLPNGLTVLLAPKASAETVTGIFAARAGWKYETRENNGIAHFLEHMAFKGTGKRPTTLDIAKEVDGRGGDINAFTSEEMTGYWIKMPHQFMPVVCDLISDMLLNSKLEPEEIEKESGTIIQELRMYEDSPHEYASSVAWPALLYGDQPAGWNGVGTEENIKAMKREQFMEFLEKLYVAKNTVFCLAGRLPRIKETMDIISKYFNNIKKGPPKIIKPPVVENQQEPKLLQICKDIQQIHMVLGTRTFSLHDPRKYTLCVNHENRTLHSQAILSLALSAKNALQDWVETLHSNILSHQRVI